MNSTNQTSPKKKKKIYASNIDQKEIEISSKIKVITKELQLISKLLKAKKENQSWELCHYQELLSCISDIKFETRTTLNKFESIGISIYNNWDTKVKENKNLIEKIKKEIKEEK